MSLVAQLAAALGRHPNVLRGYLKRGLTVPADGESIEVWVVRARAWCAANRGKTGPKPGSVAGGDGGQLAHAELRLKRARAERAELELRQMRGEVHSRKECEAIAVRRYQEMSNAFGGLGDALARRLYQQTPDAIKVIVDDEVRRRLAIVAAGGAEKPLDAGAAGGDPAA